MGPTSCACKPTAYYVVNHILIASSPSCRDILPSNIVHWRRHGILLDFHTAKSISSSDASDSPTRKTGKLAYMAQSLHFRGGQHSCETDMESLFYSLMDVASGGRALRWRNLTDPGLIRASKYATVHDDQEWEHARTHCRMLLWPLLERVRKVVRQEGATVAAYLIAFDVG